MYSTSTYYTTTTHSISKGKLLDVIRQVRVLRDSHDLEYVHSTSVVSPSF